MSVNWLWWALAIAVSIVFWAGVGWLIGAAAGNVWLQTLTEQMVIAALASACLIALIVALDATSE